MSAPVITTPSLETLEGQKKEPLGGAFFWVVAFFVVYCARPEDYIRPLRYLHPAQIVGIFALIAFVMSLGRLKEGLPREVFYLILFLIQLGLASLFSPVWKGNAFNQTFDFSKMVLIVIVMMLAVTSVARLRKLIFVQVACAALIALISIKWGQIVNGRLVGALNGIYSNPNDLALSIVLSLPFCLVFLFRARGPLRKIIWTIALLWMTYAVIRTGSRSGFIALVIAIALCLWHFGVRGRRLYLPVLAVVAGIVFFAVSGQQLRQRFADTFSSQSDNESASASAIARRKLLIRSLEVTEEHPLFGVGPGNFQVVSGSWQPTHNVYTALSAEAGIPALILFLIIYWRAFGNLRKVRKWEARDSELGMFASAMHASLWAFALAGPFFPDAYQYFVYFMLFFTSIAYRLTVQRMPAGDRSRTAAVGANQYSMMTPEVGAPVR